MFTKTKINNSLAKRFHLVCAAFILCTYQFNPTKLRKLYYPFSDLTVTPKENNHFIFGLFWAGTRIHTADSSKQVIV